jgi:hypothetical protein
MDTPSKRRWTIAGVGAAAGLTAGLVLGGLGIATAATSSGSSTSTTTPAAATPAGPGSSSAPPAPPNFPAHGSAAHEDHEKPVTGTAATQAQAAAVKSVGSGTAGAVTTDFTGKGYEVTVTKPDGTQVEVHLDSSFNAMQGPGGHQGPGRPNDNDADDQPAPSTTSA